MMALRSKAWAGSSPRRWDVARLAFSWGEPHRVSVSAAARWFRESFGEGTVRSTGGEEAVYRCPESGGGWVNRPNRRRSAQLFGADHDKPRVQELQRLLTYVWAHAGRLNAFQILGQRGADRLPRLRGGTG